MSDYTPTTEQAREACILGRCLAPSFRQRRELGGDFDRWLEQVKAEAWKQGYASGHSNAMRQIMGEPNASSTQNPYRSKP